MAATAQALHEGDDIVAGSDAVAEVEHFDGSLTRLDTGATAALRRIVAPTGQPHVILDLGPGASWHRTSPSRARGGRYEACTAGASALTRSATFVVRTEAERSWIAALAGTVVVRGRAGGMVVLRAGESVVAAADGSLDEVGRVGLDALAADDWVAVNAVLDAEEEADPDIPAVADDQGVEPPVAAPEPQPDPADEDPGHREHPWRVGVAAGIAVTLAVFSIVIARGGTTQTAVGKDEAPSAVPGPPAFSTPAVEAPTDDAPEPAASPPEAAPTAQVTSRSCARSGGNTVVYTGVLHNHATTAATFRVTVNFISPTGAVVASAGATVADVPADGTRTFRVSGSAARTATACDVAGVQLAA